MSDDKKQPYDWRYENSINTKDRYLELGIAGDPKYDPFRTNRSLSNFVDTVLQAQDMNMNYHIDAKLQYDSLFYSIRKKKRFFKAGPKQAKAEMFTLVQEYFKYSNKKTHEAINTLTQDQLDVIKKKMDKGGVR